VQQLLGIWCHGCAEGSSVLKRVRRDVRGTAFPCRRGIRRPWSNDPQARMNPAGRDASVAPDFIAALSCSVVTDRSWLFAGMTEKTPVTASLPHSPSWTANRTLFLVFGINHSNLFRNNHAAAVSVNTAITAIGHVSCQTAEAVKSFMKIPLATMRK